MHDATPQAVSKDIPVQLGGYTVPARRSRFKKFVLIVLGSLFALALIAGTGFYFYWQSLKSTPQYSLALIVEAAKRNDQSTVNRLVDINAVVDDFLPQITDKAVELYGRGLPPDVIQRVARVAAPVMPAVKDRAREELPNAIRQKTAEFGYVPFEAIVIGAEQYLDIRVDGDSAMVKSLVPEQDLEVRMKRDGSEWKIVAVKDHKLATNIAQRVGQEIIAIAANGPNSGRSRLGVKNINNLLNEAEKIFR
jgi:hypothetical protein